MSAACERFGSVLFYQKSVCHVQTRRAKPATVPTTRGIVTRRTPDPSPGLTERSRSLQTLALLMLTDRSLVKLALTALVGGARGL